MTKFVRTGGSLGYVCGKAETWFKSFKSAQLPLGEALIFVRDAYAIADEICNILSCDLDAVMKQAQRRPTAGEHLVSLHPSVGRRVDEVCRQIVHDNTRWTTKSRARWGLQLLRFLATLNVTRDLDLLKAVGLRSDGAEEHQSTRPDVSSADRLPPRPAGLIVEREPPQTAEPDSRALLFRAVLTGDASPHTSEAQNVPSNYGIDLPQLRRLAILMFGPAKQRGDVSHKFEATTPNLVNIYLPALTNLEPEMIEPNLGDSGGKPRGVDLSYDDPVTPNSERVFPAPQWEVKTLDLHLDSDVERKIRAAVVSVRRKKVTVTEVSDTFFYTYGVLRDIERTFASGKSVIISGISGTGKSTILSRLPALGATVFEVGTEAGIRDDRPHRYRLKAFDQLLRAAKRIRGRKVLICHEFFIDRKMISQLGIFDQFAFGGDPKQPGSGDAKDLFDFVREIGGRHFTLPIVWRTGNPLSAMTANYVAYGSQFKLCERAAELEGERQFDLVECDDDACSIGRSMVTYALGKSKKGRSVIIAAASPQIVAAVKRAIAPTADLPTNVQCRYLSDLQGREADVLVVDLHDVATVHPRPDEALKHVLMLLGRARSTCCIMLGKRNMTDDPKLALPAEVFFGVLLRHRVRSFEKRVIRAKGAHFESFATNFDLILLDEETIKIQPRDGTVSTIKIVLRRDSHNIETLIGLHCVIEGPMFFEAEPNIEREIAAIHQLMRKKTSPGLKVYTFGQIEDFLAGRLMRPAGR